MVGLLRGLLARRGLLRGLLGRLLLGLLATSVGLADDLDGLARSGLLAGLVVVRSSLAPAGVDVPVDELLGGVDVHVLQRRVVQDHDLHSLIASSARPRTRCFGLFFVPYSTNRAAESVFVTRP